jgi:lysophospholipase L1-like esterase
MKILKKQFLGLLLAMLALNACAFGFDAAAPPLQTNHLPRWVPATATCFNYVGRFDFADPNAPVIIWQASRITLDFEGNALALCFGAAKGQNFFNAQVDGTNTIVEVREGSQPPPTLLAGFGTGRHHLILFKRSEALVGTVRFCGIAVADGAKVWPARSLSHKLAMEFIGDSITVGACNEDGAADQWISRRTHNAASSYAALTADAMAADHRNIAVSGMGISAGWVKPKAGEIWDKLYPDPASPRADLTNWMPQIVFVNLGENDDSFSRAHGQVFPTNYTSGYIALIHAIRSARPAAHIVVLRGGMFGGARSESLRVAWEAVVAQLEAGDKNICHYVFHHWTPTHPRVADDQAMADELTAWLKRQKFMRP